jgi:hypothetical protein
MKRSTFNFPEFPRRSALKELAAPTAMTTVPSRASEQEVTLRWWSPQSAAVHEVLGL